MKIIEKINKLELDNAENDLSCSVNYEKVRKLALDRLDGERDFWGISEKSTVYFDSARYEKNLLFYRGDEGLAHAFEVEIHDSKLDEELALYYKQAFVQAYIWLRDNKKLKIW